VADTVLLAFDRREDWPTLPALLRVFVADANVTTAAALAAGATLVTPAATHALGMRGSRVRDPIGNIGWISAVVEEVPPDEAFGDYRNRRLRRRCVTRRRASISN
jgi:uncharacterized glyoxalase superfamily protein PhnB